MYTLQIQQQRMASSQNQIKQFFDKLFQNIQYDLRQFVPLVRVCEHYNTRVSHVVLGVLLVFSICILVGLMPRTLSIVIGLVYPAYMSIKNIREHQPNTEWLTYWILFAFMTAFDQLFRWALFFLPAYYLLKSAFFIWLYYPRFNGVSFVAEQILKPKLHLFKHNSSLN